MSFTAQDVAKLRQQTGVGMMECKKALTEANGDFEKAIVILRERGLKAVDKNKAELQVKVLLLHIFTWAEKLVFWLKLTVKQTLLLRVMISKF